MTYPPRLLFQCATEITILTVVSPLIRRKPKNTKGSDPGTFVAYGSVRSPVPEGGGDADRLCLANPGVRNAYVGTCGWNAGAERDQTVQRNARH
jgi:hypothetical protein